MVIKVFGYSAAAATANNTTQATPQTKVYLSIYMTTLLRSSPGHWLAGTHLFFFSSITWPLGHSQRATHCVVQMGMGLVQLGGQAEPQLVKSWPSTGHSAMKQIKENYIFKVENLCPIHKCSLYSAEGMAIYISSL